MSALCRAHCSMLVRVCKQSVLSHYPFVWTWNIGDLPCDGFRTGASQERGGLRRGPYKVAFLSSIPRVAAQPLLFLGWTLNYEMLSRHAGFDGCVFRGFYRLIERSAHIYLQKLFFGSKERAPANVI